MTQVRVTTWALWGLIALGPTLAVVAIVMAGGRADTEEVAPAAAAPGVLAFAELVVRHHVSSPTPVPIQRLLPATPLMRPRPDDDGSSEVPAISVPQATAAIIAEPAGPGRYGVQVLVLQRSGSLETWQVTVTQTPEGPVAEGLPAVVDTPAIPTIRPPATGTPQPPERDDPVATTAEAFLRALLLGDGDLARYLSPGADLSAPDPPPFRDLAIARTAQVPLDASRLAVLVEVVAERPDAARQRMQYPLLLTQRDGRPEVDRILPALPLDPNPRSNP